MVYESVLTCDLSLSFAALLIGWNYGWHQTVMIKGFQIFGQGVVHRCELSGLIVGAIQLLWELQSFLTIAPVTEGIRSRREHRIDVSWAFCLVACDYEKC